MKPLSIIGMIVVLSFAVASGIAGAGSSEEGMMDRGKSLFNDPKLGTNGKSCNTCHKDGKGLQKASSRTDLEHILNGCITQGLKGKALDVKSEDMQSLVTYVKSFGAKKQERKKPAVGC